MSQMQPSVPTNFSRISEAILYLQQNFRTQPSLEEVAKKINVSPFHFQRIFTEWAGVSPKKFLQYLSLSYAKEMIADKNVSLFEVADETGLSGTGRLHDLFVSIEGMTPGEFKAGGAALNINYHFSNSMFGRILLASTSKGLCYIAFADEHAKALDTLKKKFPAARLIAQTDAFQKIALDFFNSPGEPAILKLHLKGTAFQLKVWEALLKIPPGKLTSYGKLASGLSSAKACRAVGTAIGDNPVAFIIPCHRVIQTSGMLGGYHWGLPRKAAMIGWEAAHNIVHV